MPSRQDYFSFINDAIAQFGMPDATRQRSMVPGDVLARTAEPPTLGQGIPPEIPSPTLGEPVERRMFGTQFKNDKSEYWSLPEDKQRHYNTLVTAGYPEQYAMESVGITSPPWLPTGKISGIGENLSAGLTSRTPRDVPASSPLANAIARLFGEGAKYGSIASTGVGLGGAAIASGAARIAQAEDNQSLVEGAAEAATGPLMAIGGATKTAGSVNLAPGVAVQRAKQDVFRAPLMSASQNEAMTLASFGYTPDAAAALQKAWETKVINPTADAIKRHTPEKIKEYVNKVFGGRTSDPGLAPILTERELAMQTAQVKAKNVISDIEQNVVDAVATQTGKNKDEIRQQVFKFLDPTVSPDNSLGDIPPMYRSWMERARTMLDDYSKQLVDLGVGPTDAIQKNIGEYMKRYYQNKSFVDTWRETSRNWFKRGLKEIKGRKLRSPEDYAKRKELGLVEDYRYAFSRTIGEQAYNVSAFNAYRKIAANAEWASATENPGWKLMPKDPKKYGDLADKWIRPDIFDNVQEMRFFADRGTAGRLYDKLLASWKFGKTALSPATHGRNIMSNVILADFGGLSPLDVPTYTKALGQYFRKGKFYREAVEDGLLGSDWYGYEIGNYLGNVKKGDSMFDVVFDRIRRGKFGRAIEKAGDLYQGEEHFFKLALYMNERAKGATRSAAAAHAQKHLFDYSDLSPFLQNLRRSPFGGPFLAFTAKAVPVMVETAAKHPWRVGKYYAMFEGMNAYSRASLGMNDQEYRETMDALPPWQRNGMTIMLPFRDNEGRPVIWDLTYNMPWGDLTESGNILPRMGIDIPVAGPLVERFVGSNPALTIPVGLGLNRDPFTGGDIVNTTGDQILSERGADERIGAFNIPGLSRAAEKRFSFLFKQLAPGAVLSGVAIGHAVIDGKTKNGQDISIPVTLLNKLLGIKTSSVDVALSEAIQTGQYKKLIDELRKEYIKVYADESLSEDDKASKLQKIEDAINEAQSEFDNHGTTNSERDTSNLPPLESFDFMNK